jgi:heme/copper-type cytochrome/quinol oxidase subunit 4
MSDNHTDHESGQHDHSKRHMILMMLCCMLTIMAIVAVATLFPEASYLNFLFILICPISMVLMMLPNWLSKNKKAKESCH